MRDSQDPQPLADLKVDDVIEKSPDGETAHG
jgi:hypothetical protein